MYNDTVKFMNKLSTEERQAIHIQLVTELTAAYKQREDMREKVNQAIRNLRAAERLCSTLAEQITTQDQIRLSLAGKGVGNE